MNHKHKLAFYDVDRGFHSLNILDHFLAVLGVHKVCNVLAWAFGLTKRVTLAWNEKVGHLGSEVRDKPSSGHYGEFLAPFGFLLGIVAIGFNISVLPH